MAVVFSSVDVLGGKAYIETRRRPETGHENGGVEAEVKNSPKKTFSPKLLGVFVPRVFYHHCLLIKAFLLSLETFLVVKVDG